MRATRACSADQCENPWQICLVPGSTPGLSTYLSAKRACVASIPGRRRLLLQGASESTGLAYNSISVTVALLGMVAHIVIEVASVSVQAGVAAFAGSEDTPAGALVPGALTMTAGRHGATVVITATPSVPILRNTPASI